MTSNSDKITVGLTSKGTGHLEEVMATGWFASELDAYRLSITVAIAQGLVTQEENMAGAKTKYNIGSLDSDGKLRQLLTELVPGARERPYEYAERLADAGLAYLAEKLGREGSLLVEALGSSTAGHQDMETKVS
jgi:hypothetical protein